MAGSIVNIGRMCSSVKKAGTDIGRRCSGVRRARGCLDGGARLGGGRGESWKAVFGCEKGRA